MESAFRDAIDDEIRLIETFLWTPENGVIRRGRHVARLARSAARLGFAWSDPTLLLDGFSAECATRMRLTMDRHGRLDLTSAPYQPLPRDTVWSVRVSPEKLSSTDPWLSIKSTRRALYDKTRAALPKGIDEVLFLNESNELCEGTITNVFADFGQGLVTPPLTTGLLPGVLREEMLDQGDVVEQTIPADRLVRARAIFVGNSLRGLVRARLA